MYEWDLTVADEYIKYNALDTEDWTDAESERKIALLNVSKRTLDRVFKTYEVPNEAYYLFANTLASAYNDTMVQAQRGVASFSLRGISFTFKDWMKKDLTSLIPDEVYDIIGAPRKGVKWTVM